MGLYFFDTSALIKRFVAEAGTGWVQELTQADAGHALHIVRLTTVEMVAAITRRQRGGSLSQAQAEVILEQFARQCDDRYLVAEVTPTLLEAAIILSRRHGLRANDAVQLAAACDAHLTYQLADCGPVTLVSADRELNAAATAEGLIVDDPARH